MNHKDEIIKTDIYLYDTEKQPEIFNLKYELLNEMSALPLDKQHKHQHDFVQLMNSFKDAQVNSERFIQSAGDFIASHLDVSSKINETLIKQNPHIFQYVLDNHIMKLDTVKKLECFNQYPTYLLHLKERNLIELDEMPEALKYINGKTVSHFSLVKDFIKHDIEQHIGQETDLLRFMNHNQLSYINENSFLSDILRQSENFKTTFDKISGMNEEIRAAFDLRERMRTSLQVQSNQVGMKSLVGSLFIALKENISYQNPIDKVFKEYESLISKIKDGSNVHESDMVEIKKYLTEYKQGKGVDFDKVPFATYMYIWGSSKEEGYYYRSLNEKINALANKVDLEFHNKPNEWVKEKVITKIKQTLSKNQLSYLDYDRNYDLFNQVALQRFNTKVTLAEQIINKVQNPSSYKL